MRRMVACVMLGIWTGCGDATMHDANSQGLVSVPQMPAGMASLMLPDTPLGEDAVTTPDPSMIVLMLEHNRMRMNGNVNGIAPHAVSGGIAHYRSPLPLGKDNAADLAVSITPEWVEGERLVTAPAVVVSDADGAMSLCGALARHHVHGDEETGGDCAPIRHDGCHGHGAVRSNADG